MSLGILREELSRSFEELLVVGPDEEYAYHDPKAHGLPLEVRKNGCPCSSIQLNNFNRGYETNEPFVVQCKIIRVDKGDLLVWCLGSQNICQ
jgi:hypothetical protein